MPQKVRVAGKKLFPPCTTPSLMKPQHSTNCYTTYLQNMLWRTNLIWLLCRQLKIQPNNIYSEFFFISTFGIVVWMMNPTDWCWELFRHGTFPRRPATTNDSTATQELLTLYHANVQIICNGVSYFCRKDGVECSTICYPRKSA